MRSWGRHIAQLENQVRLLGPFLLPSLTPLSGSALPGRMTSQRPLLRNTGPVPSSDGRLLPPPLLWARPVSALVEAPRSEGELLEVRNHARPFRPFSTYNSTLLVDLNWRDLVIGSPFELADL